jgi:hypothetical protein
VTRSRPAFLLECENGSLSLRRIPRSYTSGVERGSRPRMGDNLAWLCHTFAKEEFKIIHDYIYRP